MKKAAVVMLLAAGVLWTAGRSGKLNSVGNFVADVHAENETERGSDQEDTAETFIENAVEDRSAEIDTSITIGAGSRIAVVSKAVDGEFWKLVRQGMEDAVKDVNKAYDLTSDDEITMTFEGASNEEDLETQINTLDAVIAENPTVLCLSAADIESCQAQLEAALENGIPAVAFDSNVSEDSLIAAFRGTDNTYVGQLAGEKLAEAIGGSGKIAVFSAQEKTESSQKRVAGFKDAIGEYTNIMIVRELYTDKVDDMAEAMASVLNSYPDLAGVFCTNGDVSDLYLTIEKDEKSPVMVGVDATTEQQKAVAEGNEAGIVSQNPYEIGYQTIIAAVQAMSMSTDETSAAAVEQTVLLEPKWIDGSNIEALENTNYLY